MLDIILKDDLKGFVISGLNLFVCVTLTFFSEQSMLKILYAIGWGLPLTLVIIYVIWRAAIEDSYKVLQ